MLERAVCCVFDADFDDIFAIRDDFGLYAEAPEKHELERQHFLEPGKLGQKRAAPNTDAIARNVHQRYDEVVHFFIVLGENVLARQLDATQKQNNHALQLFKMPRRQNVLVADGSQVRRHAVHA